MPADFTIERDGVKCHAFATSEELAYGEYEEMLDRFIGDLQTILPLGEIFALVSLYMSDDFITLSNTAHVANDKKCAPSIFARLQSGWCPRC